MKALKDYQVEGQLSIFDVFNRDILFGKTCAEPLVPTTEKISEPSLKKPVKWLTKMPMFLDLRKDRNGHQPDVSWVTDIVLLGECMTHNSGVSHKEESAYVYSLTMGGGTAPEILFELIGETEHPEAYKAIADIREQSRSEVQAFSEGLSRNTEQGEQEGQGTSQTVKDSFGTAITDRGIKTYDVRISSEGTKNQRAHCYETDKSRALDTGGENPDSNHGGVAVVGCDTANEQHAAAYGVVAKGNGDAFLSEEKHTSLSTGGGEPGQGYPCVCYGISPYNSNSMKSPNPHSGVYEADTSRTLELNGGSPACNQGGMAVVSYGLDRASFNQGKNAKFSFSVDEELAPSLVAKGPGGVLHSE